MSVRMPPDFSCDQNHAGREAGELRCGPRPMTLHHAPDRALLDELPRADRALDVQTFAKIDRVFASGLRHDRARLGELRVGGKRRLVREIIASRGHHATAQRPAFIRHRRRGDELHFALLEHRLEARQWPRAREDAAKLFHLRWVRIVNVTQLATRLREPLALPVDVPVIQRHGRENEFPLVHHGRGFPLGRVVHSIGFLHVWYLEKGTCREAASMKKSLVLWAIAALLLGSCTGFAGDALSDKELEEIGRRVWQNECGGTRDGLTSWNAGEDFASLGIGHFIWYPRGQRGPFEESFPRLAKYLASQGVSVPAWAKDSACPWSSRAEFQAQFQSARMKELRELLFSTLRQQSRFLALRLEDALPKMLDAAPPAQRAHVREQFERLRATSAGTFAMIDYVNFKGEGSKPEERYNGQGWGLLQVLMGMSSSGPGATREFASSAAATLTRRVENSPPARNESRWLPGWKKRVRAYVE